MDETQKEFLKDLDIEQTDPFAEVAPEEKTEETEPTEEEKQEAEQKAKNRRERRLMDKLQKEREANIDLNARLQTISEAQRARETTEEADYLKLVEKIYGNETPEAREATETLKQALKGVHESARKEALAEALERIEEERGSEEQAVAEEEQTIDDMIEEIEENYDVDLSPGSAARNGFLSALEKFSRKDKDGDIVEYADPFSSFEYYQSTKEKPNSRAKELASRSMTRSGSTQQSSLTNDATEKFLKEAGII